MAENGKLVKVEVTEPGAGYTTPPKVAVEGFETAELVVTLHIAEVIKKNASLKSIVVKK